MVQERTGFEPVTLPKRRVRLNHFRVIGLRNGTASRKVDPDRHFLRDVYVLTTSPSGRARPLGEVVCG